MTALWISLIVLLFMALLIIFLPLLRTQQKNALISDQQQQNVNIFKDRLAELANEQAQGTLASADFLVLKTELEKALLVDVAETEKPLFAPVVVKRGHWLLVGAVAFFVILISLAMYVQLGRSEDFSHALVLQAKAQQQAREDKKMRDKLAKLVTLLKEKLAKNPADLEKWHLLANSYAAMEQFSEAAQTYQTAMKAVGKTHPHYAVLNGSFAQMLFQAADEQMTPAVKQAMLDTLVIDPIESSALLLRGIDAYTQGNVKQAIADWQKAKIRANENLISQFIDPIIHQAQIQVAQMPSPAKAAVTNATLVVQVSVDKRLKKKLKPEQVVFIFARSIGGKMPLAIERLQVKDLPATVILDDSKAAMPTAVLSSVAAVEVTARVSVLGQAREAAGDFFATPAQVQMTNAGKAVSLLINQQVP